MFINLVLASHVVHRCVKHSLLLQTPSVNFIGMLNPVKGNWSCKRSICPQSGLIDIGEDLGPWDLWFLKGIHLLGLKSWDVNVISVLKLPNGIMIRNGNLLKIDQLTSDLLLLPLQESLVPEADSVFGPFGTYCAGLQADRVEGLIDLPSFGYLCYKPNQLATLELMVLGSYLGLLGLNGFKY